MPFCILKPISNSEFRFIEIHFKGMKTFIKQYRIAKGHDNVLFWSHVTNRFWALPKNVGEKLNFIEVKSFE